MSRLILEGSQLRLGGRLYRVKTIQPINKANPYHDEKGRFTTGGGSRDFGQLPSKVYHERLSTKLTTLTGPLTSFSTQQLKENDNFQVMLPFAKVWSVEGLQLGDGMQNECHYNSAKLYSEGKIDTIISGMAYSDGHWINHSWGMKDGRLVETTGAAFDKYFGFDMKDKKASEHWNIDDFVKGEFKARAFREHFGRDFYSYKELERWDPNSKWSKALKHALSVGLIVGAGLLALR